MLWPLIELYLQIRILKGKETKKTLQQKKSKILAANNNSENLIWLHGASVGETVSMLPLVENLSKNKNVLVTSGTLTSAKMLEDKLPKNCIYQPLPIDRINYVQKFLEHFKPQLLVIVESEIWPNLIKQTNKRNIPIILASARISPKTQLSQYFYIFFLKSFFQNISQAIPQDNYTANLLQKLMNKNKITNIANLKKVQRKTELKKEKLAELKRLINNRKIFLCCSTHPGEEEIILQSHLKLKQNHPDILTIIAPRHPNRTTDISTLIAKNNLSYAQRSKQDQITKSHDIYLADTIGELAYFYQLADFSLIGGSLVRIGGHNPLEAIREDCLVLAGPYIFAQDIYKELEQNQAYQKINESNLSEITAKLFQEAEQFKHIKNNASKLLKQYNSELKTYLDVINAKL